MPKRFFWISVGLVTFMLGTLAAYVFWSNRALPIVELDPVPAVAATTCADSPSFPGRSAESSRLKKNESGYFPKGEFGGKSENLDPFLDQWYGKHLKAMGERSLLDITDPKAEAYRFLWLRSFHHPIYVRVENTQKGIFLSTKELGGAGGYEPGKIIRGQDLQLNQGQWCEFVRLLENTKYWNMPTDEREMGNDGAEWILEGVKNARYHVVDRWSPRDGEYREACVFLLRASGIDVEKLGDDLY